MPNKQKMNIPTYLHHSNLLYVCIVNLEGKYIYVNEKFQTSYSYLMDKFIGESATKTIWHEDIAKMAEVVETCVANPQGTFVTYLRKPASNKHQTTNLTKWEFSTYFDEGKVLKGILCIGQEETFTEKQVDVLRQFPDSFFIIDSQGLIADYHLNSKRQGSLSQVGLENTSYQALFPDAISKDVHFNFSETLANNQVGLLEYKNREGGYNLLIFNEISYNAKPHVLIIERDISAEKANIQLLKEQVTKTKAIWESMTDLFHFVNSNWEIEYANSAWEKFFNVKTEDYQGKNVWEVFPEAVGTVFYDSYLEAAKENKAVSVEGYYGPRNQWYSTTIYPFEDGLSIYTKDITETKLLQEKENELESKLKSVWDKLIDGYVYLDLELQVEYSNPAWNKLFGFSFESIKGKKIDEIFAEGFDFEILEKIKKAEKTKEVQKHLSYFSKQKLWVNLAIFPTDQGYDIYMQDVSHQEMMRNAMFDLSFMTSHELRHEYAKLHSIINLLSSTEEGDSYLIKEANKSLIQINSLISVMNDKLTFNREISRKSVDNEFVEFDEIIFIDDDYVINFINTRVVGLMFKNIKVQTFTSGKSALEYLKVNDKNGKKLIFIDLNMPGFNGWEFLESYQKFEVTSSVYILTSSINPADIERSMKYKQVLKFLTKPLSNEMLENERIIPLISNLSR